MAPVVDKAVKQVSTNVCGAMSGFTSKLECRFSEMIVTLKAIQAKLEAGGGSSSGGSEGSGTNTCGNKVPADPFPGFIEDYTVLIPIAMGISRCGGCCTCQQNQMCLFNLYVQLILVVNKYPNWQPPNIFKNVFGLQIGVSKNSVVLEMLLKNLGKLRCKNCLLCKQISGDVKLAFMFNTDVIGKLFEGDDKNKQMLISMIMSNSMHGGMGGGIESQLGFLPLLMSMMNGTKKSESCCPFMTNNDCNSGCTTGRDTCSSNDCSGGGANDCTGGGVTHAPCPGTVPTKPIPAYGLPGPNTCQPAYGIPSTPGGNNVNPPAPPKPKPAYGVSYGSYN